MASATAIGSRTVADLSSVPAYAAPAVALCDLWTAEWRTEPITATWSRYFPKVPRAKQATYRYPPPYSEEFWRLYAEPVEEVIGAARLLRAAVSDARPDDKRERDDEARERNAARLNALVSLAGPALIPIGKCRRARNRLGFADQLAFVRLLNRFPKQQDVDVIDDLVDFTAVRLGERRGTGRRGCDFSICRWGRWADLAEFVQVDPTSPPTATRPAHRRRHVHVLRTADGARGS